MKNQLECTHYGPCAGCVFDSHLDRFPLVLEAQSFFRDHGIVNPPVHFFGAHSWRTRAKLAVRGNSENPEIGLFQKKSHNVLSIPHCRVHHPSINQAVEIIRKWIIENEISPYNEHTNNGLLRYIQCTVERSTGKIQLVLVCNQPIPPQLVDKLYNDHSIWHSIWCNVNTRSDNVIFGDDWSLIRGDKWLWERLANVDCCFHPAGFAQANLTAYEALLQRLGEWVAPTKNVIEYYAGTGIIGLTLAAKGCVVRCFEVNGAAEEAFNLSKASLNFPEITWHCSATAASLTALFEYNDLVVVVDPPRKGLDNKTLDSLSHVKKGTQLVYVSCGWSSFQRDMDVLLKSGWKLLKGEIYIFFPGSDHIETLSLFERQ